LPYSLDDKLVIGVTTRALFDLSEATAVFEQQDLKAYRDFQREHEQVPLGPGTAFPLIRGLLEINRLTDRRLVEVVLISRNDAESAIRVFNSVETYGLAIERGAFRGGRDPWPILKVFNCSLFLSAESAAVVEALRAGVPAALVLAPPSVEFSSDVAEVRIAFDGDAVLFGDESEQIFQKEGLAAFERHEVENAARPMDPGPFEPFLRALKRIQDQFPDGQAPIRTALVTSRNAPAHMRVVNTLREWGVRVDEAYFLGGLDKTPTLEVFKPHIFFDDQASHVEAARSAIPSAHVVATEPVPAQLVAFDLEGDLAGGGPIVVIPPMDTVTQAPVPAGPAPEATPTTVTAPAVAPDELIEAGKA